LRSKFVKGQTALYKYIQNINDTANMKVSNMIDNVFDINKLIMVTVLVAGSLLYRYISNGSSADSSESVGSSADSSESVGSSSSNNSNSSHSSSDSSSTSSDSGGWSSDSSYESSLIDLKNELVTLIGEKAELVALVTALKQKIMAYNNRKIFSAAQNTTDEKLLAESLNLHEQVFKAGHLDLVEKLNANIALLRDRISTFSKYADKMHSKSTEKIRLLKEYQVKINEINQEISTKEAYIASVEADSTITSTLVDQGASVVETLVDQGASVINNTGVTEVVTEVVITNPGLLETVCSSPSGLIIVIGSIVCFIIKTLPITITSI
jgi:hypothetical protein